MALALACSIFALKSTVFSSELTTEDTFDDNTDSLSPTGFTKEDREEPRVIGSD